MMGDCSAGCLDARRDKKVYALPKHKSSNAWPKLLKIFGLAPKTADRVPVKTLHS